MIGLLLQTKLFKPVPRPALVPRSQLIGQLNDGLGAGVQGFSTRLTLVSAPAGFGKTTLVATWLAQLESGEGAESGVDIAWLSLDENDNDPVRFLSYLVAALQKVVPGIGATTVGELQSPDTPATDVVLTLLLNKIGENGKPVILVLDDYHQIANPAIHQSLIFLLDYMPPLLHLLITTRSDPPLPLAQLRAAGALVEIRAADLRFSDGETAVFLNQLRQLGLPQDSVLLLARRTEGWIAGLHLAALSLQNHQDKAGFIASFAGTSRFIMDYLVDEVLQQRPAGTGQFLLQTAFLDPLCASLCDMVTGREDSQVILELLEEANLFVTALDDARVWYRYHPLFADVLLARLDTAQQAQLPEWQRRAAGWYASHGVSEEAIRYALAANDFEGVARLLEQVATTMLHQGASVSLIRWLNAMPEEVIRARPRLCLTRGWCLHWGPELDLDGAEEWARLALQAAQSSDCLTSELAGEIAALQAAVAVTRDDQSRGRTLSMQALADLPLESPWRCVVALCLGAAHLDGGDMVAAAAAFDDALTLSEAAGVQFIRLAAASFLADLLAAQGELDRAAALYEEVLAWSASGLPQKGSIMAHAGLGAILYERNRLDEALQHVQRGMSQLSHVGSAYSAFVLDRVLARVELARGEWDAAVAILERASQVGQRAQVNVVMIQAPALSACLQLVKDNVAAAEAWAEQSGLSAADELADHPGWREVAYLALARVLSAQGRHGEALSLLQRLLCAAEAEARNGSTVVILAMLALVHQVSGNGAEALTCLERGLRLAQPQGYVRTFVDEGEPMRELLQAYRAQNHSGTERSATLAYARQLLAAFPAPGATPGTANSMAALSERELDVLRLAASGASNNEIAQELFIALPTVKKHMSHILLKLDTHNRVHAIARARELGLLS